MVGREHDHRCLRVAARHEPDRQGDGGGGVAFGRFGDDILRGQRDGRGAHGRFLILIGENEHALRRDEAGEAPDGFLEQRLVGKQLEKLLGPGAAAEGPEAFAAAAGEDEHVREIRHGWRRAG